MPVVIIFGIGILNLEFDKQSRVIILNEEFLHHVTTYAVQISS